MSAPLAATAMGTAGDPSRPNLDAAQSHGSDSSNGQGQGNGQGASASAPTGGSSTQSGPPYLCPTCQTSYSRLEYLRRHERRHADIRPFVCDCGKGFSRSDVLSRHKRQCAVHLSGGAADTSTGKASTTASAGAGNGAAAGPGKKGAGTKRKASGSGGVAARPRKSSNKSGSKDEDEEADENSNGNGMQMGYDNKQQQQYMAGYPQQQQQQQRGGVILPPQPYQHHMPMGSVQQQGSFPFPLQPGMSQGGQSSAPLMPPAPYGGEGGGMPSQHMGNHMGAGQGGQQTGQQGNTAGNNGATNSPFGANMAHHLSAINSLVNQHNNYPSSPESSGTLSQHGSPRFMARDMSRHNSGSSRFSLRKSGGSFDHIGPRQSNMNQSQSQQQQQPQQQQQYSADFWNALDPAAKTATTGADTDYVSATTGASYPPLSLADGTGAGGISTTPGIAGLTTPRGGDLQRFAVSSGPLSPFSSIALNSTMSPYLSAFSNARDTPFVASPSRGVIPGTPGSSLNVFDWTMRPPSKPASSSQKRDSVGNSAQAGAGGVTSSPSGGKRRQDDESGRKSPRIQEKTEADLDADQRSAAELLDSLRNSGQRAPPPTSSAETSTAEASSTAAPADDAAQKDAGAAGPTSTAAPSDTSGQSFFEQRNATSGPDAFRLNLQQGGAPQQQNNGALAGVHGSSPPSSISIPAGLQNGVTATSAAMAPSASTSSLDVPQKTWDAILNSEGWFAGTPKPSSGVSAELASLGDVFPSTGMTPLSAGTLEASTKWLMSPGVQQIINSFAPQPGDFGSYFSGATTATGANLTAGSSSLPALGTTSTTPAVSSNLGKSNGSDPSKAAAATPSILTSSQALERALADPKNPFYVSPDLFKACYSVPHWDLPPATRLSMLALYAQQNLVKHAPVIHEPTFRLDTTPGCIAFAMCMLGCHEQGRQWWTGAEVSLREDAKAQNQAQKMHNGSTEPFRGEQGTQLTRSRYDEEDGQILVRPNVMEEKTGMLVKSFPSHTTSAKDRVSVVQVLLLFQTARLISHDEATRTNAALVHPTLVSLARQANVFDVQAEPSERHVRFTPEEELRSTLTSNGRHSTDASMSNGKASNEDESLWRQWSELAGRRRTAYGIFVMDTVLHQDANAPERVQPAELEHLPLPSPDTIWRAPNVDAWKQALIKYQGPRFGEAMRALLSSTHSTTLSGRHGAFARLALVVALLRGVAHLLESRNAAGAKPSPLQAFMPAGTSAAEYGTVFQRALQRWRESWDQDDLCLGASGPQGHEKLQQVQANDKDMSVLGAHHLFASQTACSATALADDALPFYWVARVVLETRCGLQNVHADVSVSHLVSKAQNKHGYSTNGGSDGSPLAPSDFRALLRVAKDFVMADERV